MTNMGRKPATIRIATYRSSPHYSLSHGRLLVDNYIQSVCSSVFLRNHFWHKQSHNVAWCIWCFYGNLVLKCKLQTQVEFGCTQFQWILTVETAIDARNMACSVITSVCCVRWPQQETNLAYLSLSKSSALWVLLIAFLIGSTFLSHTSENDDV